MFYVKPTGGSKKTKIGRRRKNGTSNPTHEEAVASGLVAETNPEVPPEEETLEDELVPKKERADNKWRESRAVVARDKKINKLVEQNKALTSLNCALEKDVSVGKEKVKELQHNLYLEKKLTREKELLVQHSHKLALSALMENCALEIEDAFAVAADATNDKLEEEKKRLEASSEFTQKIREERRLAREKAEREHGRHDDVIKK